MNPHPGPSFFCLLDLDPDLFGQNKKFWTKEGIGSRREVSGPIEWIFSLTFSLSRKFSLFLNRRRIFFWFLKVRIHLYLLNKVPNNLLNTLFYNVGTPFAQLEYMNWKDLKYGMDPWRKVGNLPLSLLRRLLVPHPSRRYKLDQIQAGVFRRFNMELGLQSLFGLLCTAVLIVWDPATPPLPPHLGSYTYEGAKIDDISLLPRGMFR
jgi:hypothetical protein